MLHSVYLGLGSNLDNPIKQVVSAIDELGHVEKIDVRAVSNIYKSKPLEVENSDESVPQEDYINAVVQVDTSYKPEVLLDIVQAIELKHHRVKMYRWGPRSLDIDILIYDEMILKTTRLVLPHIEIVNRDFVLYPLNDINPNLVIPKFGKLSALLSNVSNDDLVLLGDYLEVRELNQ